MESLLDEIAVNVDEVISSSDAATEVFDEDNVLSEIGTPLLRGRVWEGYG